MQVGKMLLDTSDPETKALWQTAQRTAAEVAAWPAWKRGEDVTDNRFAAAIADIDSEASFAMRKFAPFNSAHEGFAVLKEEVDELWDEVKAKQGARDATNMRKEAVQVAAMALRFIVDICDNGNSQV